MPYVKTKALIMGKKPVKEHDKLLTLLLEDGRRIEAKIRKARDTASKWGSVTEPVSLVEVEVYDRAGRYTITGINIEKYYGGLDYNRMVAQEFVCEVIDKTTAYSFAENELFDLACRTFDALVSSFVPIVIASFMQEILAILGYPMHVSSCLFCADEITTDAYFDVSTGSVVCPKCKTENCIRFPLSAVSAVKELESKGFQADLPDKMCKGLIQLELRIIAARFETNLSTSLHLLAIC